MWHFRMKCVVDDTSGGGRASGVRYSPLFHVGMRKPQSKTRLISWLSRVGSLAKFSRNGKVHWIRQNQAIAKVPASCSYVWPNDLKPPCELFLDVARVTALPRALFRP